MKKTIILGCNSFSGASLTNFLLNKNHLILGFSRSKKKSIFLPYLDNKKIYNFKFKNFNLNLKINSLLQEFDSFKPDYIIDFSGQGMVAQSFEDPINWLTTNVLSKLKIMNHLISSKYLKKYIKISTPEVYGSCPYRIKPTNLHNPSSPYALSHSAIDYLLNFYHLKNQFPIVTGRFANFYGPHQQLYRIIPKATLSFLKKEKFTLDGNGLSKRSFIYSSDFCEAILAMIKKGTPGKVYHFSNKKSDTIKKIVQIICNTMNIKFSDFVEFGPGRFGLDKNYLMDCNESYKDLNWLPKVTLNEGLLKTINWYKDNFDHLKNLNDKFQYKK